jgi:[ribosomal protein S5]-alanine N-acetyltransferase
MAIITSSARFTIREMAISDAPFILDLLNQQSFIEHIGDRNIRSLADAEKFILEGPLQDYKNRGFSMWIVENKLRQSVGMCGLLQRDYFDVPDIGYAISEAYSAQGIATESARAVIDWAKTSLKCKRLLASTSMDNESSARVLEKLGFKFDHIKQIPEYDSPSKVYSLKLHTG